ncbi:Vacuolar protein sorting-associated protein [Wickerhamomyces ciferrii]|uniref:Vacuolar protein sorting-associated protein n=1 Tax=Wickerhamomyces ciferrii (strain ATCC 14091 / BCRC 22168 / CBS 111 / JCM 3599 / NBRC 0793 / NRRL Y-1031 F-60-10) TaxID=1206466 RepID=K0KME9_WICCF|nr:Vacuolar protein sorting-associated protein [Wickerhamomyces ciferrii]CCH43377.1 Vacuolar protein sorting-associated protein [Wickerhamomyces ciferrii]
MSSPEIPTELPKNLITFINRSKELEKADSIISYFCKLYTVEQILNQGLHQTNEKISTFALYLLDSIETFKNDSSNDVLDIINDKETSQIYIINFSDKIFNNSLNQIHQKKSGKSTALGFLASVNFYELLKLWNEDDKKSIDQDEINKKIRYGKFHAARILKNLKKGEDPNEYDPPELNPVEDEDDDVVDEKEEVEKKEVDSVTNDLNDEQKEQEEQDDLGLGLPQVPKFIDDEPKSDPSPKPEPKKSLSNDTSKESSPNFQLPNPPNSKPEESTNLPTKPVVSSPSPQVTKSTPTPAKSDTTQSDINDWIKSGEIYQKAQKHAKFAISAMNYEDKDTAIKQLNDALELLNRL